VQWDISSTSNEQVQVLVRQNLRVFSSFNATDGRFVPSLPRVNGNIPERLQYVGQAYANPASERSHHQSRQLDNVAPIEHVT